MFLTLLLASVAAGADCPAALEQLSAQAEAGISAFEDMDAEGFEQAVVEVEEMVACPESAVDGLVASRLHLLMALDAYTDQESERAREALRAVLAADPSFSLSSGLAPWGNPLREIWDKARRDDAGPTADLAKPTEGSFYVDGLPATTRPSDRPFVLQWIDDGGHVRWSDWLPAGAHLPIEVLAAMHEEDPMSVFQSAPPPPVPVQPALPLPDDRKGGRGAGVVLLAGAGGVALASGGLLAAAMVSRGKWQSSVDECVTWGGCEDAPDAALAEQTELAQRARTLGYAAQGSAGLALGLGIVGGITLVW
jgi:hypothetical protein